MIIYQFDYYSRHIDIIKNNKRRLITMIIKCLILVVSLVITVFGIKRTINNVDKCDKIESILETLVELLEYYI